MKKYYKTMDELTTEIVDEVTKKINKDGKFEKEINYVLCVVEILPNDYSTLWVKWGKFDCAFMNLSPRAMGLIADEILF